MLNPLWLSEGLCQRILHVSKHPPKYLVPVQLLRAQRNQILPQALLDPLLFQNAPCYLFWFFPAGGTHVFVANAANGRHVAGRTNTSIIRTHFLAQPFHSQTCFSGLSWIPKRCRRYIAIRIDFAIRGFHAHLLHLKARTQKAHVRVGSSAHRQNPSTTSHATYKYNPGVMSEGGCGCTKLHITLFLLARGFS